MIIEVVKEFCFDAAHYLPGYQGKCKDIHGHRWVLQIGFAGEVNPNTGMVIDFTDIKEIVNKNIVDRLDHKFLNDIEQTDEVPTFPCSNPTAENMVAWMVKLLHLEKKDLCPGIFVTLVRLYESPTSYAEWELPEKRL